jgi:Ala-tRNA(Pro) deacylase
VARLTRLPAGSGEAHTRVEKEVDMASTNPLTEALDRAGVGYEVLEHSRTDRAADEAAALGLRPNEVAKTIVVTAGDENLRVILPASERIDMHKLRELLDAGKELHLLTEEQLGRDYPEFELGAVPPLGGRDDGVVVDSRVARLEQVVFEAGEHDRSIRVPTAELVSTIGARVGDVCAD